MTLTRSINWSPARNFTMALVCALITGSEGLDAAENKPATPNLPNTTTSPLPSSATSTIPASTNAFRAASATNALDDKLKLGIGDRLSYRIVEDLEDPKSLIVTDSGDIEVPLIGRVPAVDKTCKQLAAEVKTRLEEDYYYNATVVLAVDLFNRSRGRVYLVGYVRAPGPLEIPSDEVFTVGKAVMRAGGFSDYADKRRVRITRKSPADPNGRIIEVDVGSILEDGRSENDLKLEVGDLIYVPSRLFKF